uniref:Exportin-7 n=1 Tax=Ascaris suum TaxID=6253 RepID=F1KSW2_ASCSU
MNSEIQVLDNLCKMLYESVDNANRLQAERALAELATSPECLQRCTLLLQSGTVPYAQLVASNTLLKLLTSKTGVNLQQRLELCTYLLNYLGERSSSLPPFVVSSLCQLFARLTKLGWLDYDLETKTFPFREPVNSIARLAEESVDRGLLAVQLLALLVSDMNTMAGVDSISKQRKIALSFRDCHLLDIFKLSTSMLEKVIGASVDQTQLQLVNGLLQLSLNCLTFDFIGSLSDESGDDNVTVQVPTIWRIEFSAFTDGGVISMFFRLYNVLPMELSGKVLQNIVQLSSLRRTLFSSNERQAYLAEIVKGVKAVMERPDKLRQQESFHEFCRVVSRLKSNYQLCELMKVEEYAGMMALLADFTIHSLRAYEFSVNSTYYLLSFWQRMVSSVPYVKATDPHLLNLYCPKITSAFIESRLEYAKAVVRGEVPEDPLDDQVSIQQVMEQFAIICRCEYDKSAQLMITLFDHDFAIFERATNPPSADVNISVVRLTWLVTIIGAAVQGRAAFSNSDEHDVVDGDLVCRVLKLMELSDGRLSTGVPGNLKLEMAFLYTLEQFRKVYVSDQIQKLGRVYDQLEKNLGLQDESAVLVVYVRKIITNLKYWAREEKLIDQTLNLLNELSLGYTAARRLVRLPDIQLLLNNHTAQHFAFLSSDTDLVTMRSRTTFYASLMRLLCLDLSEDDPLFISFMQPLTDTVREICDVFAMNTPSVDQERVQRAVIGLCRDIRGVAISCHTKMVYAMLFDWLYPNVFSIMARSVELWTGCTDVVSPVLKLLCELCQNKQQRLQFEMSSCSAVLLFREVSKIICTYGERMLALPAVQPENAYRERYKNISSCFATLKMALSGSYVPFGVFRLYGDTCLQDALSMFVKMFMVIPESDFHSYAKIAQNFYSLLECIAQDNICFLSNVQPDVFTSILRYIQQGTVSLDAVVVTASCATLDMLLNYLYRRLTRATPIRTHVGAEPEGENCIRALEAQPSLLSEVLAVMLNAVIFDDVKCQWSMSRPLLGLILLQEEFFQQWKMDLINQQPAEKRVLFEESFAGLMDGIERNLNTRNKDVFTQNLTIFRRSIVEVIRGVATPTIQSVTSASDMMS